MIAYVVLPFEFKVKMSSKIRESYPFHFSQIQDLEEILFYFGQIQDLKAILISFWSIPISERDNLFILGSKGKQDSHGPHRSPEKTVQINIS